MGRINDVVWESLVNPTCLCIPCRLGSLQFKRQGYLRELEFPIPSLLHKGLMKKEAGGKCSCFSSLGWGSCSLLLAVSHRFCHYSKKGKILKLFFLESGNSWGDSGTLGPVAGPDFLLLHNQHEHNCFGSFEKCCVCIFEKVVFISF